MREGGREAARTSATLDIWAIAHRLCPPSLLLPTAQSPHHVHSPSQPFRFTHSGSFSCSMRTKSPALKLTAALADTVITVAPAGAAPTTDAALPHEVERER
eukprot:COSAG01_NODE_1241_length_11085_cov_9.712361_3_plen_101_part_00